MKLIDLQVNPILAQLLQESTIPDGVFLFRGAEYIGKRSTAHELIKVLLCETGKQEACTSCNSCVHYARVVHPDIHIVRVAEDAQNISIEQIQILSEKLSSKPQLLTHNIVVIENVDDMTLSAANALLKTLEEPKTRTLFLLTDNGRMPILDTIRSRSIEVLFSPTAAPVLESWLVSQGVTKATAKKATFLSKGLPILAKMLADDSVQLKKQESYFELLLETILAGGSFSDVTGPAKNASWSEKQQAARSCLEDCMFIWHNILLYSSGLATYLNSYHNQKALSAYCETHSNEEIAETLKKAHSAKVAIGKSIPGDVILETLSM